MAVWLDRIELQRLCGILVALTDSSTSYAERLEGAASRIGGGYGEKLRAISDKLRYLASRSSALYGVLCESESVGPAALEQAVSTLGKLYTMATYGEPPLPSRIRALVYEAYMVARMLSGE